MARQSSAAFPLPENTSALSFESDDDEDALVGLAETEHERQQGAQRPERPFGFKHGSSRGSDGVKRHNPRGFI
jgi:hypothetical protein